MSTSTSESTPLLSSQPTALRRKGGLFEGALWTGVVLIVVVCASYSVVTSIRGSTPLSLDIDEEVVSAKDFIIISIGSTSRPELQVKQRQQLGKYFEGLVFLNEDNTAPCEKRCTVPDKKDDYLSETHPDFTPEERAGWWCAQKRSPVGIEQWIKDQPYPLPDYVLVIDDDTFVTPLKLRDTYLKSKRGADQSMGGFPSKDQKLIFGGGSMELPGDERVGKHIWGGAGYFMTKALLTAFKKDGMYDRCVSKLQGGEWCRYHSDWVMSVCAEAFGGTVMPVDPNSKTSPQGFKYGFNTDTPETCTPEYLTCHPVVEVEKFDKLLESRQEASKPHLAKSTQETVNLRTDPAFAKLMSAAEVESFDTMPVSLYGDVSSAKFIMVTYANTAERLARVVAMAKRHSLALVVAGMNTEWHGVKDKMIGFAAAVQLIVNRNHQDPVLFIADGDDTLVQCGADEFVSRFNAMGAEAVFQGEAGCYPVVSGTCKAYEYNEYILSEARYEGNVGKVTSDTPGSPHDPEHLHRYLNSGQMFMRASHGVHIFLEAIPKLMGVRSPTGQTICSTYGLPYGPTLGASDASHYFHDQLCFNTLFLQTVLSGGRNYVLDVDGSLSMSIFTEHDGDFDFSHDMAYWTRTKKAPCAFHGNSAGSKLLLDRLVHKNPKPFVMTEDLPQFPLVLKDKELSVEEDSNPQQLEEEYGRGLFGYNVLGSVPAAAPALGKVVVYRLIGADLPPYHSEGSARDVLAWILENEGELDGAEQRFLLNHRGLDDNEANLIKKVLKEHGVPEDHIKEMPRLSLTPEEVNRYTDDDWKTQLLQVNDARNFMIKDGKAQGARWTVVLDGSCFFAQDGWKGMTNALAEAEANNQRQAYVAYFRVEAKEKNWRKQVTFPGEPQIAVRSDSTMEFDETKIYPYNDKLSALLSVTGEDITHCSDALSKDINLPSVYKYSETTLKEIFSQRRIDLKAYNRRLMFECGAVMRIGQSTGYDANGDGQVTKIDNELLDGDYRIRFAARDIAFANGIEKLKKMHKATNS